MPDGPTSNGRPGSGTIEVMALKGAKPTGHAPIKYRHVAAVHARSRASILSSEHEGTTSFVGFRNLLVIVVSM